MQGPQRQKACPRCGVVTGIHTAVCGNCGREFRTTAPPPPPEQTTFFQTAPPPQVPPAYQPQAAPPQQLDLYALLALVTLLLGFFMLTLVFGVASIILAVISLHRQNAQPHLTGKGMAIASLLLGIVWAMWGAMQIAWSIKEQATPPVAQ